MVLKCRFCEVDLESGVESEQWSLNTVDCLKQVISDTGLTVFANISQQECSDTNCCLTVYKMTIFFLTDPNSQGNSC